MGKSIGIDLGTTNSVVAFKDLNVKIIKHEGKLEELVRSCVAFPDGNSDPIVGKKHTIILIGISQTPLFL